MPRGPAVPLLALLLAVLNGAPALGLNVPAAGAPVVHATHDALVAAGVGDPGLLALDTPVVCGGTAPLTNDCEQTFTALPNQLYTLNIGPGTAFTGTVTARLFNPAGGPQRVLTCTYIAFVGGLPPGPSCTSSGSDPSPGSIVLRGEVSGLQSPLPGVGGWEVTVH
jgi:hypothetical protein